MGWELSYSECIDIIVHMCEKLGFVLIDRNAFPYANEARSAFAVVEPENGDPVFGLASIEARAKHLELLSTNPKISLEVNNRKILLARMCLCREFEISKENPFLKKGIPNNSLMWTEKSGYELARKKMVLRIPNPFFGKWDVVKRCSCAEEAILLLEL